MPPQRACTSPGSVRFAVRQRTHSRDFPGRRWSPGHSIRPLGNRRREWRSSTLREHLVAMMSAWGRPGPTAHVLNSSSPVARLDWEPSPLDGRGWELTSRIPRVRAGAGALAGAIPVGLPRRTGQRRRGGVAPLVAPLPRLMRAHALKARARSGPPASRSRTTAGRSARGPRPAGTRGRARGGGSTRRTRPPPRRSSPGTPRSPRPARG